jgi:glycosyltransferase involved in cell wall biosynthesis
MKAHVCVDARLINQAGIGTFLKGALRRLNRDPSLLLTFLCYKKDSAFLSPLSSRLIPMQSQHYTLKEQAELAYKIPSCDLFWAPHFNIPLLPIRAKKRLTTVCDAYHLANAMVLTRPQRAYAQVFYNAACLVSDTLMTISEFSKNELLKHTFFSPKKIEIVTPPFDFCPAPPSKRRLLLAVGNLKPHKNLWRLVMAYDRLRPDLPLYLVGKKDGLHTVDKDLLAVLRKNPFLNKSVHITGYISEQKLKDLYARTAVFIFPSLYEGYGYPPLEAMASGCPVVASHAASIPEVCEDAAEYVDPLSIDSIADGIQHVLYNKTRRKELIEKGKLLVERKRKKANRILDVIYACCNRT